MYVGNLLKKKVIIPIIIVLLGFALLGSFKLYRKIYYHSVSSVLFVKTNDTALTTYGNLLLSTQLTKDYVSVIYTHNILEKAIEASGEDMTCEELKGELEVVNLEETRILEITVTDKNKDRASRLSNAIAEAAANEFGEIFETNPPIILENDVEPR